MRSIVVASAVVLLVPASAAAVVTIDAVRPLAPSEKRPARVVVQATDSAGPGTARCRSRGGGDAVVTVGTGGCAPDAPRPPTAAAADGCRNADVEVRGRTRKIVRKAIHCLVHARRRAAGARSLRTSPRLQKAAARHALDMHRRAFFAHTGPGGPTLADRLERVRFWPATVGENLAAGIGALVTARAIVDAWMGSATHRANMLDERFEYIGIGIEPSFPNPPISPGATVAAEFGTR